MTVGRARLVASCLVLAVIGPGLQQVAGQAVQAGTVSTGVYRDFQYARAVRDPTEDKPQSKLWYAHGVWWGLLANADDGTVHIYRLADRHVWRDTGVMVDDRVGSTADVLWDGSRLYVVSRVNGDSLEVSKYSFDVVDEEWSRTSAPARVDTGESASATIAKDSLGRLWVTYTQGAQVWVVHTTAGDRRWTAPFRPAVADTTVSTDDISSVVSFDGRIGVMWSDQDSDRYTFAVHDDDADDSVWTAEDVGTGFLEVDDHLNLQTAPSPTGTRVLAAVKTSLDEVSGVPAPALQIAVLDRSPEGEWTTVPAGTVADGHTRPILAIDSSNNEVYLIVTSAGLGVFYKRSPLDDMVFTAGRGQPLLTSPSTNVSNPTSSKAPVTADSGLVVLADAGSIDRYFHAEVDLSEPDGDDSVAPTRPGVLVTEATDGCQVELIWPPAIDDVEVLRYELQRDGADLAAVTSPAYTDATAGCASTHRYTVRAVDSAGNASAAISGRVRTPAMVKRGAGIWLTASSAAANKGGSSLTVPRPPARRGDVLMASVDAVGTPDIAPAPGWRLVRRDEAGDKSVKATYIRLAAGRETGVDQWTWQGRSAAVVNVLAYRGVSTDDPVVSAAGQVNGPATVVEAPGVAVGPEGAAVIGLFGVAGLVSITPSPDMVGQLSQGNKIGPRKRITGSTAELVNAEVATSALSVTTSHEWPSIGHTVVLRPDSPDGG